MKTQKEDYEDEMDLKNKEIEMLMTSENKTENKDSSEKQLASKSWCYGEENIHIKSKVTFFLI